MADTNKTLQVKVLQVTKTTTEWNAAGISGTILDRGAIGIEISDDNKKIRAKAGDGTRQWAELPYISDPSIEKILETILNNSSYKGTCKKSELEDKKSDAKVGDIWLVYDDDEDDDETPEEERTYTQYIYISKDGESAPEWVPIGSTTAPYTPEIAGEGPQGTLGCIRVGGNLKIDKDNGVLSVNIGVLGDKNTVGLLVPQPSEDDVEKGKVLSATGQWIDAVDAKLGETVEELQKKVEELGERTDAVEEELVELGDSVDTLEKTVENIGNDVSEIEGRVDQIESDLENDYICTHDIVKMVCIL